MHINVFTSKLRGDSYVKLQYFCLGLLSVTCRSLLCTTRRQLDQGQGSYERHTEKRLPEFHGSDKWPPHNHSSTG